MQSKALFQTVFHKSLHDTLLRVHQQQCSVLHVIGGHIGAGKTAVARHTVKEIMEWGAVAYLPCGQVLGSMASDGARPARWLSTLRHIRAEQQRIVARPSLLVLDDAHLLLQDDAARGLLQDLAALAKEAHGSSQQFAVACLGSNQLPALLRQCAFDPQLFSLSEFHLPYVQPLLPTDLGAVCAIAPLSATLEHQREMLFAAGPTPRALARWIKTAVALHTDSADCFGMTPVMMTVFDRVRAVMREKNRRVGRALSMASDDNSCWNVRQVCWTSVRDTPWHADLCPVSFEEVADACRGPTGVPLYTRAHLRLELLKLCDAGVLVHDGLEQAAAVQGSTIYPAAAIMLFV